MEHARTVDDVRELRLAGCWWIVDVTDTSPRPPTAGARGSVDELRSPFLRLVVGRLAGAAPATATTARARTSTATPRPVHGATSTAAAPSTRRAATSATTTPTATAARPRTTATARSATAHVAAVRSTERAARPAATGGPPAPTHRPPGTTATTRLLLRFALRAQTQILLYAPADQSAGAVGLHQAAVAVTGLRR